MTGARSSRPVVVPTAGVELAGDLMLPADAGALVTFAHGSGSSRFSQRNRYVAEVLQGGGLGTLLFDLLTPEEHQRDVVTAEFRFDIPRLAERLVGAVDWLRGQTDTAELPLGLFGASTGAAAALICAARRPIDIAAVVSRGGRPDLALEDLPAVTAPTLLIVGGDDDTVIELNRLAAAALRCEHRTAIVPGATHLFEEPGTLTRVAELARDWFEAHQ